MRVRWATQRVGVWGCILGGLLAGAEAQAGTTYGPNGPGSVNTNQQTVTQSSTQTTSLISDRVSSATSNSDFGTIATAAPTYTIGNSGKAAGSEATKFGLWGSASHNWLRNTQTGVDFNGTILNVIGGFDYKWAPWLLTGIAGGYEGLKIATGFNSGTLTGDTTALAVYGAVRLAPNFGMDAELTHSWVNYNGAHGGVTSFFTGDRWAAAANINASRTFEALKLAASLGYFHVAEVQTAYSESNGNAVPSMMPYLGQVRLKGQAAYTFQTEWGSIMPFASARLEFDAVHSDAPILDAQGTRASYSAFGTTFGAGVKAMIGDNTSFILEGKTTVFRQYFESYGINASFRVQF